MPSYAQSVTLQYVAWDTVNNVGKTGDSANHTLRWVKDGTSAVPTNAISEVDATNAPGIYKITMTTTETSCYVGTLCGKSSTSGISILPITITFERNVTVDMTEVVPTSNTAGTVGDALNAARAQGFGKWILAGTSLTLFGPDGSTVVHTFTLDSASAPTTRS